jgi:uncharacterized protein
MRLRTAVAVAATTLAGAGTAALAAGRYGSGLALRPAVAGPAPDPLLGVRKVTADRVVLTRGPTALRPGVYGLAGIGVHAAVGAVTAQDTTTVTRELLRVDHGTLTAGDFVRTTAQTHRGDPGTALGLSFEDVTVPGELGPLPAWFVPGPRATWVILVHGAGATREHALNLMPALYRFRLPQLVVSCRNDPGAPASPDGLGHLGATEWRDVDAAVRYAADHGVHRIVLLGWGTGATMALTVAAESAERERVAGLVLDSPVLDWRAAVRGALRSRGLPAALTPLAVRAAEGRTGRYGLRHAHPPEPVLPDLLPVLLAHGPDDTFADWHDSRRLAELKPGTVAPYTVPGAPHAAMWNADPKAYEETLRRFLTPLM